MDHQQFDSLTRAFAHGLNRRSIFRGILGGAAALVVGRQQSLPIVTTVSAAESCSATNSPDITCEQINGYVASCGVLCADRTRKLNHGGCTYVPPVEAHANRYRLRLALKRTRGQPNQYCGNSTLTVQWKPQGNAQPQVTTLNLTTPDDACCQDKCAAEYNRALSELATHEQGHVTNWTNAVAAANLGWTNRTIVVCKPTKAEAESAWNATFQDLIAQTSQSILDAQADEPPQANPINCDVCKPTSPNQVCCNDTCVTCPDGTQPDPETCECGCPSETVAAFTASGATLCCPELSVICNDQCCDGSCTDNGECCPYPRKTCGDTCCADGQTCCESEGTCGPAEQPCDNPCAVYGEGYHTCIVDDDSFWCCAPECTCCPGVATCICDDSQLCCGPGRSQCYDTCCTNATEVCAGNTDIGGYCCPDGAAFNKDTMQCCAVGETSVFCTNGPEACCPVDNPNWCECCGNCE